jgi:hypothetical protein
LSAVKRPPLITVKCSLKHFSEQVFQIDLALVSWKDIDLIPSVEDAWLLFKSAFLSILNKPTALRIGNTVTTDKSKLIDHFNKHFFTAVHAFHLATPTPANISAPPAATR